MQAVRLSNPMRYLVPAVTALLAVVMFIVPLAFVSFPTMKVGMGAAILLLCVAWQLRSAWRAPHALAIDNDAIAVRSLGGERSYTINDIRAWRFAIPDGPPTQLAPQTNAVLYLTFADGTRFRGEVTAEEASTLAAMLPAQH